MSLDWSWKFVQVLRREQLNLTKAIACHIMRSLALTLARDQTRLLIEGYGGERRRMVNRLMVWSHYCTITIVISQCTRCDTVCSHLYCAPKLSISPWISPSIGRTLRILYSVHKEKPSTCVSKHGCRHIFRHLPRNNPLPNIGVETFTSDKGPGYCDGTAGKAPMP